ncbi:hypothetical protein B0T18DRAFT_61184 [Schizothecium vesticola]|uniref:Uncharacterized protein n=1 Tax=Schizothecium vesticola TaxID=314040 RepID=A0AA40K9P0_9PEZI|nr:hypothetical protein B0T18DRAFT_61184 [Schizothecium vesticola]
MEEAVKGFKPKVPPIEVLSKILTEESMKDLRGIFSETVTQFNLFENGARAWGIKAPQSKRRLTDAQAYLEGDEIRAVREEAIKIMDDARTLTRKHPNLWGADHAVWGTTDRTKKFQHAQALVRTVDSGKEIIGKALQQIDHTIDALKKIENAVGAIKRICFGDGSELALAIHEAVSAAVDIDEKERLRAADITHDAVQKLVDAQALASKLAEKLEWTQNKAKFPRWTPDSYVHRRFRRNFVLGAAYGEDGAITEGAKMGFVSGEADEIIDFDNGHDQFYSAMSMLLWMQPQDIGNENATPNYFLYLTVQKKVHDHIKVGRDDQKKFPGDNSRIIGPTFFGRVTWDEGDKKHRQHAENAAVEIIAIVWDSNVINSNVIWDKILANAQDVVEGGEATLQWSDDTFRLGAAPSPKMQYGAIYFYMIGQEEVRGVSRETRVFHVLTGKKDTPINWPKRQ